MFVIKQRQKPRSPVHQRSTWNRDRVCGCNATWFRVPNNPFTCSGTTTIEWSTMMWTGGSMWPPIWARKPARWVLPVLQQDIQGTIHVYPIMHNQPAPTCTYLMVCMNFIYTHKINSVQFTYSPSSVIPITNLLPLIIQKIHKEIWIFVWKQFDS